MFIQKQQKLTCELILKSFTNSQGNVLDFLNINRKKVFALVIGNVTANQN